MLRYILTEVLYLLTTSNHKKLNRGPKVSTFLFCLKSYDYLCKCNHTNAHMRQKNDYEDKRR